MKKKVLAVLLLAVCLLLSACGQGSAPSGSGSGEEEQPVELLGNAYDYDLNRYVELREYTGIPYKPYGNAERSTVEMGDTVTVEIEAKVDGVEEPITGIDTFVVGESNFLPGFDEGLVGHDINDTIKMDLAFPEDYGNPDYAGKAVDLTAYILILDLSYIRDMNEAALWQIVLDESTVLQYPEKELAEYAEDYRECYEGFARQYNMTLDNYLKTFFNVGEEGLEDLCRKNAEEQIREEMVMYAVYRDAGLTLTQTDLDNCKQLWLQSYGYESEEDMPVGWDDEGVAKSLQTMALERKVKSFVYQQALPEKD